MKQLIYCSNFYNDVAAISSLMLSMDFTESQYGTEIIDFHNIPPDTQERFTSILGEQFEIQPDTGIFRKPADFIHFENFYQHAAWLCIVALEDTVLSTYEQDGIKSLFDARDVDTFVRENCFDKSKWEISGLVKLNKNDFIFIRPWVWHSLEENKLVQVFLINHKLQEINNGNTVGV